MTEGNAGSAMRRIVLALAVAAVMALLVMALAGPAFAANLRADQVGKQASGVNQSDPGRGGEVTSDAAQSGIIANIARTSHFTHP